MLVFEWKKFFTRFDLDNIFDLVDFFFKFMIFYASDSCKPIFQVIL